jgi:amino acid transporter
VQTVGQARVLREVARQGLLPYATFFASTRPFGTPLGPVALKYVLTVLVLSALPARDAFNFVLDLASYPNLVRPMRSEYLEGKPINLCLFFCRFSTSRLL